jgi:type II secretory pathway component PulK
MINFLEILKYEQRKKILYDKGIFGYILNSRGYVLVLVLIIVTLLVSVTGEFLSVAHTNISYSRKLDEKLKARLASSSGVDMAKYILKADKAGVSAQLLTGKSADPNIDCYLDLWALDYPEIPVGDAFVKIEITDEQSKINLSILANEFVNPTPYYGIFQRFLMNMGISLDFADIVSDWVDPDDSRSSYGAEFADFYSTLPEPYRPKNNSMDSIDEMLMLKNMTPEIYYGLGGGSSGIERNLVDHNKGNINLDFNRLSELIEKSSKGSFIEKKPQERVKEQTAGELKIGREKSRKLSDYLRVYGNRLDYLNELNKININTASYRVLSSLADMMMDDKVDEIIRRRNIAPFKSVNDIKDIIEDENIRKNLITVKSGIFKIVSTGTYANTKIKTVVFYERDTNITHYYSVE